MGYPEAKAPIRQALPQKPVLYGRFTGWLKPPPSEVEAHAEATPPSEAATHAEAASPAVEAQAEAASFEAGTQAEAGFFEIETLSEVPYAGGDVLAFDPCESAFIRGRAGGR